MNAHSPKLPYKVTPNDESERGRVKVVAECWWCLHKEEGFGNTEAVARRHALALLRDSECPSRLDT